jgi:hypothetical protein
MGYLPRLRPLLRRRKRRVVGFGFIDAIITTFVPLFWYLLVG